jgi:hypothetical protein
MDQGRADYADGDPPPVRPSPAVVRLLAAVVLMLVLLGLCLLIGVLIDAG